MKKLMYYEKNIQNKYNMKKLMLYDKNITNNNKKNNKN